MNEQKPVDSQALARREQALVPEVITSAAEFKRSLNFWAQEHYHVLTPQADFGSLPPQWTIVPSIVRLDPDVNAGDVYRDGLFCKQDEVAPTKVGLRKIARGGGLSWTTRRTDSGNVPNYWSMSATISYRGFDGQMKTSEASYEWDLRDGSARTANMSPKELSRARLNGYRRCEAGAINAAIREYGLKQKYSQQDLKKPFVVLNLVFNPDMNDPQQKQAVLQNALSNTALLYGATEPESTGSVKGKGEVVDHFNANEPEPEVRDFAGDETKAEPVTTGVKVISVGQVGDLDEFVVTLDGGKKLRTDDRMIANACAKAKKEGKPIPLVANEQNEIIEIAGEDKGL
jgi:hypothetical protein